MAFNFEKLLAAEIAEITFISQLKHCLDSGHAQKNKRVLLCLLGKLDRFCVLKCLLSISIGNKIDLPKKLACLFSDDVTW